MTSTISLAVDQFKSSFQVEKGILTSQSDFLKELLNGDSSNTGPVEEQLGNVNFHTFSMLIKWLEHPVLEEHPRALQVEDLPKRATTSDGFCHCGGLNREALNEYRPEKLAKFQNVYPEALVTDVDFDDYWPNYCLQEYEPPTIHLVELWKLADSLHIWRLQCQVVNLILGRRKHLEISIFSAVYKICPEGSILRKLIADICCWGDFDGRLYGYLEHNGCLPKALLVDIAITEKMRKRGGSIASQVEMNNPLISPEFYYPQEFRDALSGQDIKLSQELKQELDVLHRFHFHHEPTSSQIPISIVSKVPHSKRRDWAVALVPIALKLRYKGHDKKFKFTIEDLYGAKLFKLVRDVLNIPAQVDSTYKRWSKTNHRFIKLEQKDSSSQERLLQLMILDRKLHLEVKIWRQRCHTITKSDIIDLT